MSPESDSTRQPPEVTASSGSKRARHYKQFDKFRLNVDLLQRRGFRVNVTTVITPDNWKEADEMLSSISSMGVGMTVQPGITVSFSWDDHQDILDHFKKRQRELRYSINPLDRPAWEPRDSVAACTAGTNYFMLFPDGQVYRCLTSTIFWDKKPLGHIKDFVPNAFEHPCPEGCICGCDVDAKNGKWDDAEAHLRTAIR